VAVKVLVKALAVKVLQVVVRAGLALGRVKALVAGLVGQAQPKGRLAEVGVTILRAIEQAEKAAN